MEIELNMEIDRRTMDALIQQVGAEISASDDPASSMDNSELMSLIALLGMAQRALEAELSRRQYGHEDVDMA